MAISKSAKRAPAASAETKRVEPSEKKPCFVISPIGPDESETRKKADKVLKYIIKEALSDTYLVDRADDIKKPGLITLQVVERLIKAPMVVADLTDANANVYYELAIRHLLKKPVVHLITEGQQPPFDVAPMRYIAYNLTDLDSVERAKKELRQQADALAGGDVTLTVIQFAAMAEKLASPRGEEQDPFAVYALGIQSALSNLQSDLRQVATQVGFLSTVLSDERAPYGITFNQQHYAPRILGSSPLVFYGETGAGRVATYPGTGRAVSYKDFMVQEHPPASHEQGERPQPEVSEPEPTAPPPDPTPKEEK